MWCIRRGSKTSMTRKLSSNREYWASGKLKKERIGNNSHYDRCYACNGHTFYPKRLTKKQLQSREVCPCMCHWGVDYSGGITYEEALVIYTRRGSGN